MIEGLRQIPWWRNILTQRVTQIEGCFRWSRPPHSEISASHFLDNLPTTSLTFNLLYISLQKKLVLCSHISFGQYVNIYKASVFKKVPQGQDRRHVHIQNPQLDVLREGSRNDHFSFRAFPRDLFICSHIFCRRVHNEIGTTSNNSYSVFQYYLCFNPNIRLPNWLIVVVS